MRRFLLIAVLAAVGLLYGLTIATGSTSPLAEYFWWIIALCALLMLVLASVLTRYVLLLMRDKSKGVFGSQIARRLSGMFTLVAVLPGVFLFGISAQFINGTINSWFGNDTHEALERSLNLSKSALNLAVDNAVSNATPVQIDLISTASVDGDLGKALKNAAKSGGFTQLSLYDVKTHKTEKSVNPLKLNQPELDKEGWEKLEQTGSIRSLENIENVLYAQGWMLIGAHNGRDYALFFRQPIPQDVAQDATLIEAARAKYAELSYTKQGLQTFFLATLLVAALLAIFLALVMALYFARRLAGIVVGRRRKGGGAGRFQPETPRVPQRRIRQVDPVVQPHDRTACHCQRSRREQPPARRSGAPLSRMRVGKLDHGRDYFGCRRSSENLQQSRRTDFGH